MIASASPSTCLLAEAEAEAPTSTKNLNYHSLDPPTPAPSNHTADPCAHPNPAHFPLPRPKLWPILLSLALLDLASSVYFLVDRRPADIVILDSHRALILTWTFTRAFLIALTSASRRIRTLGWVFASTGMISMLLFLWTTNEFIQTSHQPGHIPATKLSLASFLAMSLLLFLFPLAHWCAFLVAVGVTNARNPFVGRSLGLGNATRSEYWNWAETSDEDAIERVVLLDDESESVDQEHLQASACPPSSSRSVASTVPTAICTASTRCTASVSVSADDEHDQVSIISSPTSTTTIDEQADDEEPDPDDILDIPAPSITPLTPSLHFRSLGRSTTSSRSPTTPLRNRNSWLSKQASIFEEADERQRLRRASLAHYRTASCTNACHTHLPHPESLPSSPLTTPKQFRTRPAQLGTI